MSSDAWSTGRPETPAPLRPPLTEDERDALLLALGDCVARATEYGSQSGGFVYAYILPTGPIHRAIPLLERYGIYVRPGYDGRPTT